VVILYPNNRRVITQKSAVLIYIVLFATYLLLGLNIFLCIFSNMYLLVNWRGNLEYTRLPCLIKGRTYTDEGR